jgi:hypothetical protein
MTVSIFVFVCPLAFFVISFLKLLRLIRYYKEAQSLKMYDIISVHLYFFSYYNENEHFKVRQVDTLQKAVIKSFSVEFFLNFHADNGTRK